MHLVVHTQYFSPEIGAPQRRLGALVDAAIQDGHKVTVLTAFPNYPRGKIASGYRGFVQIDTDHDLRVVRVWVYATQSVRFLPRGLSYLSFAVLSLVVGIVVIGRADYWLTESPPLFLGPSGCIMAWAKRARWIFNVSDLWPESAVQLGVVKRGGIVHKIAEMVEQLCYRLSWLVVGQSDGIISDISSRFQNLNTRKLSNGVVLHSFPYADEHCNRCSGDLRIRYVGLHGIAQGLEFVVQTIAQCADLTGVSLEMWGEGPVKSKMVRSATGGGYDFVQFHDAIEASAVHAVLSRADVILVPLAINLVGAVPSKLYEAMAVGRPVLLIGAGESARIVERCGCGVVVSPGDNEGLLAAIRKLQLDQDLRREMGRRGRALVEECYDRDHINSGFLSFLKDQL